MILRKIVVALNYESEVDYKEMTSSEYFLFRWEMSMRKVQKTLKALNEGGEA